MRKTMQFGAIAIAITACRLCFAQDNVQDRLAQTIAPYVDDQTLLVAHIDLAAIDPPQAITLLARFMRASDRYHAHLQSLVAPLNVLNNVLPEGGAADVFVVVSMADIRIAEVRAAAAGNWSFSTLPFFVVVSLERNAPGIAIALEIRRALGMQLKADTAMEQIGGAIIVGSPKTIDRLKKMPPAKRPEIAAGFDAAGDSAAHVLFVPSADMRRAVETLWPTLPPAIGGGESSVFTRGVVWMAVGLDLPAAPSAARIVMQSATDDAAQALHDRLSAIAKAVSERTDVRDMAPRFQEVSQRLLPRVSGSRLLLEVTQKTIDVDELRSMVAALFVAARSTGPP